MGESVKWTDEKIVRVRDWCIERKASKPWYGEMGDSPKLMMKCDEMISLLDEVIARRQSSEERG